MKTSFVCLASFIAASVRGAAADPDPKACPVIPTSAPAKHFYLGPEHWHDDDDQCAPKGEECDGFAYYSIKTASDLGIGTEGGASWYEFLDATPPGCVLAPIHDREEWDELLAEASLLQGVEDPDKEVYVGIFKSVIDAQSDNGGGGSRANWFNLDGTPAFGVCDATGVWDTAGAGGGNPNNAGIGTSQAAILDFDNGVPSGSLADIAANVQGTVPKAIYKCCSPVTTFAPPSCVE